MKEDLWQNLVVRAKGASPTTLAPMPLGFDTRIAARWQAERRAQPLGMWIPVLRQAGVWAAVAVMGSLALSGWTVLQQRSSEVAFVDSTLRWSLNP